MLKTPYNNLLFDYIDRFEFFLIFWVKILRYLPLLQEGTTAEFPALGSSHNRPCSALTEIRNNCSHALQVYAGKLSAGTFYIIEELFGNRLPPYCNNHTF